MYRAVIATGPNAGRLTDILNRDITTNRLSDVAFKDACCNQAGANCTLYTESRPLIPLEPLPPPPIIPRPTGPTQLQNGRRGRINIVPVFIIKVVIFAFGKLRGALLCVNCISMSSCNVLDLNPIN